MAASLNEKLRRQFRLNEVITVPTDHNDDTHAPKSDHIGEQLARASVGYLHEALIAKARPGRITRVGIAWGWALAATA